MSNDRRDNSWGIIPLYLGSEPPEVLLVQHKAGHWGFPKGHAEPGESPLQTALRELLEETAVQPASVTTELTFSESYRMKKGDHWYQKRVCYYPARVDSRAARHQEGELRACAWLSLDAAAERITFTEGRDLLQQVRDCLPRLVPLLA